MSISFHCENCKKKVNAPDGTGGKWGRCPHCNHRCYIPLPKSKGEGELKLAPIDPNEEVEYEKMIKETQDLRQDILHEKEEPPEPDEKRIK